MRNKPIHVDEMTCLRIAQATDANEHTEALRLLAVGVRDYSAAYKLHQLQLIENELGHVPHSVALLRRSISEDLRRKLPDEYWQRQEA